MVAGEPNRWAAYTLASGVCGGVVTHEQDESLLVYDSNETGTYQAYAYRLADGVTVKLSPDKNRSDQFADFEGLPK